MISGSGIKKPEGLFAADEHQDYRKDDTDDDTCGQGKIEGKILAFVIEVTGKPPDPWYFPAQQNKNPYTCDCQTDDNKNLAEARKISHVSPQRITTIFKTPPFYFPLKRASNGLCGAFDIFLRTWV